MTERDLSAKTSAYFAFCFSPRRAKLSRAASKVCAGDRKEEGEWGGGGLYEDGLGLARHTVREGETCPFRLCNHCVCNRTTVREGEMCPFHIREGEKCQFRVCNRTISLFTFGNCPVAKTKCGGKSMQRTSSVLQKAKRT